MRVDGKRSCFAVPGVLEVELAPHVDPISGEEHEVRFGLGPGTKWVFASTRGHTNILKRLLIHAGGFNLGLLLRAILGVGTPHGFQDRGGRVVAAVLDLIHMVRELLTVKVVTWWSIPASRPSNRLPSLSPFVVTEIATCATGC
jgi:hypothetical protein